MKKRICVIIVVFLLTAAMSSLSACGYQVELKQADSEGSNSSSIDMPVCSSLEGSLSQKDSAASESQPKNNLPEILSEETISALTEAFLSGSYDSFLDAHPDYLLERISRAKSNINGVCEDGGTTPLLWVDATAPVAEGFSSEQVLQNSDRLSQFYQNVQKLRPDKIALLSSGDPVPLWITVYTFDGTELTRSSYMVGSPDQKSLDIREYEESVQNIGFSQTDTEWTLTNEPKQKIRYPKYGFSPRGITSGTLESLLLEGCESTNIVVKTERTIGLGQKNCSIYEVRDAAGVSSGRVFAVADDFSAYYQVEQVNGSWLLQAQVKEAN